MNLASSSDDYNYINNYEIVYNVTKPLEIKANVITFIDGKIIYSTYNGDYIKSISKYLEIDGENSPLTDLSIIASNLTIITEDGEEYQYNEGEIAIIKNAGTYIIKLNVNDIYLNSKRIGDSLNYYDCSQEVITLTIIINQYEITGDASTSSLDVTFDPTHIDKKYYSVSGDTSNIENNVINGKEIYFKFIPSKDENGEDIIPYVDIYNQKCTNELDLHVYLKETNEDITNNVDLSNIKIKYGTLTLSTKVKVNSSSGNYYHDLGDYNIGPSRINTETSNVYIYYQTQYILDELDVNATIIDSIEEVGTYYILYTIKYVQVNGTNYEDYSFLTLSNYSTLKYNGETYYVLTYDIYQTTLYLKPYVEDYYVFNGKNISLSGEQNEIVYGSVREGQYIICEFDNNEIGIIDGKLKKSSKPQITIAHVYDADGNEVSKNYNLRFEYDTYLEILDKDNKGKNKYSYKYNINNTLSYSNRYVVYVSYGGSFTYDNEYHQVTTSPTIINDYNKAINQTTSKLVTEENYGLLEGYTYLVKSYTKAKDYTKRGYKNTLGFKTFNEDGIDVSSVFTYLLSTESEYIYILKKDVEVTSASASMKFGDQLELYNHTLESINGLLDNGDYIDESSIIWTGLNSTVGSKENTFEITKILNAKGQDVTNNYNIIYHYGTLTITL